MLGFVQILARLANILFGFELQGSKRFRHGLEHVGHHVWHGHGGAGINAIGV